MNITFVSFCCLFLGGYLFRVRNAFVLKCMKKNNGKQQIRRPWRKMISHTDILFFQCVDVILYSLLFCSSNQFTSNLCSDARKTMQLLRLGHPDLSNHPNTEFAGTEILHFSVDLLAILWYFKQLLSNSEPLIREKFNQLLGLRSASGCFIKKSVSGWVSGRSSLKVDGLSF